MGLSAPVRVIFHGVVVSGNYVTMAVHLCGPKNADCHTHAQLISDAVLTTLKKCVKL